MKLITFQKKGAVVDWMSKDRSDDVTSVRYDT